MNCKAVIEVMPELVSGELDDITAQRALDHINSCTNCEQELAKYDQVLAAASRPWKILEEPEGLALTLPERGYVVIPWKRLILAPAAALILFLLLWQWQARPVDKQNSAIVRTPPPVKEETRNRIAEHKEIRKPERTQHQTASAVSTPRVEPKPSVKKRTVRQVKYRKPVRRDSAKPNIQSDKKPSVDPVQPTPTLPEQPVIVVASLIPQPPVIEVESTDHTTGEVSIHTVTYDEMGNEHKSEIRYIPDKTTDWRNDL